MIFTTLFSTVLLAASSALNVEASPIASAPATLIVYSPTITAPTLDTVWYTGSTHNVTWDVSNLPAEKENSTGLLLLGYNGTTSENLDIDDPLAFDFPIKAGTVSFVVPVVPNRDDYFVVLFGDSGNRSKRFTIASAPSSSSSVSSIISATISK